MSEQSTQRGSPVMHMREFAQHANMLSLEHEVSLDLAKACLVQAVTHVTIVVAIGRLLDARTFATVVDGLISGTVSAWQQLEQPLDISPPKLRALLVSAYQSGAQLYAALVGGELPPDFADKLGTLGTKGIAKTYQV